MEAQNMEDEYIQEFLAYYMETGYQERTAFINFLRFITTDEKRKSNYDSLYAFLNLEIENKEKRISTEVDSISRLHIQLIEKLNRYEIEQEELIELNQKLARTNSNKQKEELVQERETKNRLIDSLKTITEVYQNKIVEKENLVKKSQKEISNPLNEGLSQKEYTLFEGPLNIDLEKGDTYSVENLGVSIVAQKVNNITNKALVWIKTGEQGNNPSYYLGINKYAVFSKDGKQYKLLVTNVYNQGGLDHSHVTLTLSKLE